MLNVPTELRTRAEVAYAHLVVDDVEPANAVTLARDLLDAGADGVATKTLAAYAGAAPDTSDAQQLLRAVFDELGLAEPEVHEAAEVATGDICARLLDGTLSVASGGRRLLGTLSQERDHAGLTLLLHLLDEVEYDLRDDADEDWGENLLSLARALTIRPAPATVEFTRSVAAAAQEEPAEDGEEPEDDA